MIGERLEQVWRSWSVPDGPAFTQRSFAVLLDVDETLLTKAKKDPTYQFRPDRLDYIAHSIFRSKSWLRGEGELEWSDDLLEMRSVLRTWAKTEAGMTTAGQRLASTFEQVRRLMPDLREDVFAAHCRTVWVEKLRPNSRDFLVHMDVWKDIITGRRPVLRETLQGAATFTGLPVQWFETGVMPENPAIAASDIDRLVTFLSAHNLDVDGTIRLLTPLVR